MKGFGKARTIWIKVVHLGITLTVLLLTTHSLEARIIRFVTKSTQYFGTFKSGDYVKLTGIIEGELTTDEAIPDLIEATKEVAGVVYYQTDFELIIPTDTTMSNGTLVFDVKNRGKPVSHSLYNSPRGMNTGLNEIGLGFLENHGFMIATVSWELGHGISLPNFYDAGQKRYIEAVGFAAVRDFAAFLKYKQTDDDGNANPLVDAVQSAIGVGYSQTARFLKSLLLNGFNRMDGKRVFDGMHLQAVGAGFLPIMQSGLGPLSSGARFPTFSDPDLPGVHVFPFTYQELMETVRQRGETPPRIIVTNMSSDYYSLRSSLTRTGANGTADVDIPKNVRVYDIAGSAHILLPYRGCKLSRGNLDWHPVMRAVLLHLHHWVTFGMSPPDNRLMPLESHPGDPSILRPPIEISGTTILVPKSDEDGNDLGGVRLPEFHVPIGTYGGQNEPRNNILCTLSASFSPFPANKAKRRNAGDHRRSIKERYPNKNVYLNKIAQAARALINEGFLMEADAAVIINATALSKTVR